MCVSLFIVSFLHKKNFVMCLLWSNNANCKFMNGQTDYILLLLRTKVSGCIKANSTSNTNFFFHYRAYCVIKNDTICPALLVCATRTLIFYFLCLPVFISAQPITFSKIFSNYPLNSENGWEIAEFKEGYILVSTSRNPDNDNEVWCNMTRLDQNGDIIWYQQLPFYPNRGGVLLIHEQLIYVTGTNADSQMVLYCIDLDGNIIWNREYGDYQIKEGGALLAITQDQSIVLFGRRYRDSVNKRDALLYFVKTNVQGDSLDEFTYGENYGSLIPRGLVSTTDRQVVFSYPFCHQSCAVDNSGGVSSMDTDGNILWTQEFTDSFLPGTCLVIQQDSTTIVAKWYVRREDPNADKNPPALYFIGLDGQIRDTFVFDNVTLADIDGISATSDGGLRAAAGVRGLSKRVVVAR